MKPSPSTAALGLALAAAAAARLAAAADVQRDPFWPVGYRPVRVDTNAPALAPEQSAPAKPPVEWPRLRVKGLTRGGGGRYLAIVDRVGVVESGDRITLREGDNLFTWVITDVTADGISFERVAVKPVGGSGRDAQQ